ncbi:hypothetical protein FOMPIDRAFT_53202 [Fomitopsis schrenkii]|uniref:Protein kinase domain-containing protein n=1 Tax=Fomitopsis schrenkii TaxID=2126942 RepID=S8FDU1_FOMSC|nr:hypothetical protein FOMPIDRAFT_53202 [Fomitopsis schrenkii]
MAIYGVSLFADVDGSVNALAMEMLGQSLAALMLRCRGRFSVTTMAGIALQVLHRLEDLHNAGYVHRNIKPSNHLIGMGAQSHTIHLVDLGVATPYCHLVIFKHHPQTSGNSIVGTSQYVSLNIREGTSHSRCDNLLSLAYVLIHFARGNLLWEHVNTSGHGVLAMKQQLIALKKCAYLPWQLWLPTQFTQILDYCSSLGFADTPDYRYIRQLFVPLCMEGEYSDW